VAAENAIEPLAGLILGNLYGADVLLRCHGV
jgi:hypothetical protein